MTSYLVDTLVNKNRFVTVKKRLCSSPQALYKLVKVKELVIVKVFEDMIVFWELFIKA